MHQLRVWRLLLAVRVCIPRKMSCFSKLTAIGRYCGSGTSFCGSGCDGAYGNCEGSSVSIPTSSSAALSATSTLSSASTIEPAQSSATGPPGCEEDANGLGDLAGPNTTFCTFQQQLECYALPYGVLGFASDVTTLYTVTLLWLGRRPLMPWRQLDKGLLTIILGGLTVTGAGAAAVANAIRCSNKWELVAISAWKLGLSVSTGLMAIHAGAMARHYTKRHRSRAVFPKIGRWLCLYSLPLLAGIAGLCSLSFTTSSGVPIYLQPERSAPMALTVVLLLALPAALVLSLGGGLWRSILKDPGLPQHPLLYWPTVVVYLFAVLWGFSAFVLAGWIIACFAENLIGVPSPGSKLSLDENELMHQVANCW